LRNIIEFKAGGRRFYAMVSPERHEIWQLQQYTYITPKTNFKFLSVFADKDEKPHFPGFHWDLSLSEQKETTTVSITIYNEALERMEKMIEMGFQGALTMTLNYLGIVLETLAKR
jgi:hypothetical protein